MQYLSIIISVIGATSTIVTLITLISKKGKEQGKLETKLDHLIKNDLEQKEDMKLLMRSHENIKDAVRDMAGRIVIAEKGLEKAHSRIDDVKKQVNKMNSEIATFVEIKKRRKKENGTTN